MATVEHFMDAVSEGDIGGRVKRAVLGPEAYTGESYFEEEKKKVFYSSWLFACSARDIPEPGDVLPVEVAGESILIIRTMDGGIRAYQNVCSHRGTKLVINLQRGRQKIVCPYHAWTYNLEGDLISAKHFAGKGEEKLPQLPCGKVSLQAIKVERWLDWIFVNLDGAADSFESYLKPFLERWEDVDLTKLNWGGRLTYKFRANWKLIVENFLESYHVPFIHRTLDRYSPFIHRYQIKLSENLLGIGTDQYEPDGTSASRLPKWPVYSGRLNVRAEYFCIFPSFLIGIMPDHLFAWHLKPSGPHFTVEELDFYFHGEGATSDGYRTEREATFSRWRQVNDEDWGIVERMHAGHRSRAFRGALLSAPMERNIYDFQRYVASKMEQ